MNQADLIWRLVEIILHKEKEFNQLATDKAQDNTLNDKKHHKA